MYALGFDGSGVPVLLATSGIWNRTNDPMRLATSVFPAFQMETRSNTTDAVELLSLAVDVNPARPWALAVNTASEITHNSAVISWTDSFDGPDFSDVVIDVWPEAAGIDSPESTEVEVLGAFPESATVTSLSPATAYRFRVRARTAGDLLGAYDFDRSFTTLDPPPLGFEAWAAEIGLDPTAEPGDETLGGGVTNLQAWIHGLNPGIPQSFSDYATQDITDDRLTLTVRVRDVSPGYTVELRGTNNLTADWLPLQVVEQSPVDPDGFVTLTVRTQSPEDIAFLGVWILEEEAP